MWAKIGLKPKLNSMNFAPLHRQDPELRHQRPCWAGMWPPMTRCTRCNHWCAPSTTGADGNFNFGPHQRYARLDAIIDQLETEPDVTKAQRLDPPCAQSAPRKSYYVTTHADPSHGR